MIGKGLKTNRIRELPPKRKRKNATELTYVRGERINTKGRAHNLGGREDNTKGRVKARNEIVESSYT